MNHAKTILLLDVDSVLVRPGGYRAALIATINYLIDQAGLPGLAPDETTLAFCESQGITNEWDMTPIILGIILEAFLSQFPQAVLAEDWEETAGIIRQYHAHPGPIDFNGPIASIAAWIEPGKSISKTIFERRSRNVELAPFRLLSRQPLFPGLFSNNEDVRHSITTELLQNFVLGSDIYFQTYATPSRVKAPSYLKEFDLPQLSGETRQAIELMTLEGRIAPVIYTARPSLPPPGTGYSQTGFAPEAEMAVELVELQAYPLIAYGRLLYLAQMLQISTDVLAKPSPFQALAAFLAAEVGDEKTALLLAVEICKLSGWVFPGEIVDNSTEPGLKEALEPILARMRAAGRIVHVVEDSPVGIQAGKQACEMLSGLNVPIEFHSWGISEDKAKQEALRKLGATIYTKTDDALKAILQQVSLIGLL